MNVDLGTLNYPAILLSAVSTFLVGGLWYNALFAEVWARAAGMTAERMESGNAIVKFGGSFLFALVSAFVLAMFVGSGNGAAFGLIAGLLVAVGWVGPFLGIFYLFEQRSVAHFLVNAGYAFVSFAVMGLIIGAWQ